MRARSRSAFLRRAAAMVGPYPEARWMPVPKAATARDLRRSRAHEQRPSAGSAPADGVAAGRLAALWKAARELRTVRNAPKDAADGAEQRVPLRPGSHAKPSPRSDHGQPLLAERQRFVAAVDPQHARAVERGLPLGRLERSRPLVGVVRETSR